MINWVIGLILFSGFSVEGQIVNNISNDDTNMWFHAIDSVAKIILEKEDLKKIYINGYHQFPFEISGVKLVHDLKGDLTSTRLNKKEALFLVSPIEIIRDQFKISVTTIGHKGFIGGGRYVLIYKYLPTSRSYELQGINWMVAR